MINNFSGSLKARNRGRSEHLFEVTAPITVYKKLRRNTPQGQKNVVAELLLPVGTLVVIGTSYDYGNDRARTLPERLAYMKMRTSYAKVVKIMDVATDAEYASAESFWKVGGKYLTYRVGRGVKPAKPFALTNDQCASGIHFYRTYTQAREH